jgi:response regulator RpfG family c-di-GMP phosphodiesterase
MEHEEAIRRIVTDRSEHFDPVVVDAFLRCAPRFAEIQRGLKDRRPHSGEVPITGLR